MVIVNWYIEVMESGIDTKQMMQFYKNSKKKIDSLIAEHDKTKMKAAKEKERLELKVKVTMM